MGRKTSICILFYFILIAKVIGQEVNFASDIVFGNRSVTYKHSIKYTVHPKLSVDNLTLFDTEYGNDNNNIYFIRNTISYSLTRSIRVNTAIGIKNPGAFGTVSLSFISKLPYFTFSYTGGSTYQNGFSLEQTIVTSYSPPFGNRYIGYINLLVTGNISNDGYTRGLQQLKIGVRKNQITTGVAMNLDQFNNAKRTMTNVGVFLKYNF